MRELCLVQVLRFLQGEANKERKLAQQEYDALVGWEPPLEVRNKRISRANRHLQRAQNFTRAIQYLTKMTRAGK